MAITYMKKDESLQHVYTEGVEMYRE